VKTNQKSDENPPYNEDFAISEFHNEGCPCFTEEDEPKPRTPDHPEADSAVSTP